MTEGQSIPKKHKTEITVAFSILTFVAVVFSYWYYKDFYVSDKVYNLAYTAISPSKDRHFNGIREMAVNAMQELTIANYKRLGRRSVKEMRLEKSEWEYAVLYRVKNGETNGKGGDVFHNQDGKLIFHSDGYVILDPPFEGFGDSGDNRITYERLTVDSIVFHWDGEALASNIRAATPRGTKLSFGVQFKVKNTYEMRMLSIHTK